MAFHYKDGWYFERLDDGGVRIYHVEQSVLTRSPVLGLECEEYDMVLDIDSDSWASVVASVSAQGDTAEAFQEARNFHHKGRTIT